MKCYLFVVVMEEVTNRYSAFQQFHILASLFLLSFVVHMFVCSRCISFTH